MAIGKTAPAAKTAILFNLEAKPPSEKISPAKIAIGTIRKNGFVAAERPAKKPAKSKRRLKTSRAVFLLSSFRPAPELGVKASQFFALRKNHACSLPNPQKYSRLGFLPGSISRISAHRK